MHYLVEILLNSIIVILGGLAILLIASFIISIVGEYKDSKVFKYEISITRGNSIATYYTNEYEIKDRIIYFNNICASNFVVKELKKEA